MSAIPRCCETGRPIVVDAGTGRTVCSCQLQRGVPSYLSRVPTLPETVYGTGNNMYSQTNMLSAMYKMYGHETHNDPVTMTTGISHPMIPMSAHAMAAHPYSIGYPGFDIHGARRKNATRETTSPLKAWLYTHKKNPYPTKAEKIMLAIVTRMTLTQVSTWFANARRRLKKENRLNGKDDDTLSDISGKDDTIDIDSSSDPLIIPDADDDISIRAGNLSDISESSDTIELTQRSERLGKKCVQKLFSPDGRNELFLERLSSPDMPEKDATASVRDNRITDLNLQHQSFDTIKFSAEKEHALEDRNKHKETENVIKAPSVQSEVQDKVPHSQPKPKIWSIAEMIG